MELRHITPSTFAGTLSVPPSKSLTHRALIIAAFSALHGQRPAVVHSPLRSDDTTLTLSALQAMGFEAAISEQERAIERVEFSGKRTIAPSSVTIDIHHSGTSARLLTAIAAVQPRREGTGHFLEIDGSPRMRQRPMQELIAPLQQLGAEVHSNNGFLPIRITKSLTHGGKVSVNASKSSQFLSALLLIAPLLEGTTQIHCEGEIASQSYSDMTIAQMRQAGILVHEEEYGYRIEGGQHYKQHEYTVEGDYSAVSYPLAAAALCASEVTVRNVMQHSLQGDREIIDILRDFGADILWLPEGGVRVQGSKVLRGVERDMNTCPDIVPTVAVVALFAETKSVLRNIEHLRYKESDRIAAVIENIERLGGKAYTEGNALVIEPSAHALHGAQLPTFDDHRIAMCFSLVGLRVANVVIEHPACVAKSYPEYWRDFEMLTHHRS
ncbi:MAG: 3-phosphoshikimate 1-carboxyvinyltransferase [Candidatus Kapaibacterium sp.]|nr:MAG: 3-phosphoshikimate 1-carboxyvinyltransferase [Candidatus Kapabacteria bacterium]